MPSRFSPFRSSCGLKRQSSGRSGIRAVSGTKARRNSARNSRRRTSGRSDQGRFPNLLPERASRWGNTMRAHEWCRVGSRNGALVCSAKFNMHLGREQRSVLSLSAFPLAVLHRSRFVPEATAQAAIAECSNRIYAARFSVPMQRTSDALKASVCSSKRLASSSTASSLALLPIALR